MINDWLVFAQGRLFYDLIEIYGSPEWRTLWQERALGDFYAWLCVWLTVAVIMIVLGAAKVNVKEVAKVAQQVMTLASIILLADACLPALVIAAVITLIFMAIRHLWQQHRCQQAQQARA